LTGLPPDFYDRPVVEVAHALIGCTLDHAGTSGVIVETEAYHQSEPACHAFAGLTRRTRPLFGPPGRAYVYRSYGIHSLFNAVCQAEGLGAAVLIRALEPLTGLERMRERRGVSAERDLCSGPGKLTRALGITLEDDQADLAHGPVRINAAPEGREPMHRVVGPRIGITRAAELPWRVCAIGSVSVSRPWPPDLRGRAGARAITPAGR
jgi:DNA-3-methyladenine glycosylase